MSTSARPPRRTALLVGIGCWDCIGSPANPTKYHRRVECSRRRNDCRG